MTDDEVQRTILGVWRVEQPRLITSLSRMLRDVPLAEDLTQETLIAALEHWPVDGVPGQARRLADGDRQAPRARSSAPHQHAHPEHGMLAHDLVREQDDHARFRFQRSTTISATNCCG